MIVELMHIESLRHCNILRDYLGGYVSINPLAEENVEEHQARKITIYGVSMSKAFQTDFLDKLKEWT